MKTIRVITLLGKIYLSFAVNDDVLTEIEITEYQRERLNAGSITEGEIMELDANQHKYVKIGEKIAFFDDIYNVLMVSKVNRIVHSDDWMATVAGDFKHREFKSGIPDNRFVFFVDQWDHAIYGNQILRNVRHIDKVVDQLIPDILP